LRFSFGRSFKIAIVIRFFVFLGMLFWHLLGHENAHIRPSMLRFSFGRSLKIAIVIQFFGGVVGVKIYLRWRRGWRT
ncbi:MAG: hypothetical protein IKT75_08960, partial [Alistipes sp.]|nr:hypothetical protein [Alistipes sp.]